ncbi:MAG: FAD-binding oxidoreductase [Chloroflexi bacterium]|nr:MAG: FAD-binding oxidoreductase [Chloroflexota bacterium]MBL1196343.1 FAD-binding oxidoreductase [Chloroflexota bacterium]NOH13638.1 FAD-binding oxidoreductase [Chloroflexota bacterium]
MNLPTTADIVVIGGGVMGASTAYHLAQRGQKNVVLLEKEEFFSLGASGRNAGGVRYQFGTEVNVLLSLESLPMLHRFPEEIDQEIDFRPYGYFMFVTNENDKAVFEHNIATQHRLGVMTEWLDGDEVRRRLPMMNLDDAIGASFNPNDGVVDPNSVVMGYINRATQMGVTCLTEVEVTGIQVEGSKISAVETNQGSINTPIVVNAAGPWAKLIGDMAGLEIPIEPIRRQMMTTTPLPELPEDFPFVIDFEQSLYWHREGDGLLVGMSNKAEKPGFDQNIDSDFELLTLEKAAERMPLLEKVGMASHWAGLYEVTPDAHPIYGSTPIEGFYLVGGFSGHGFMHGPISGLLMTEIILDGAAKTVDVSMLDFARFAENRLIHEYNVI